MIGKSCCFLLGIALLTGGSSASEPSAAPLTAIRAGKFIDVAAGRTLTDQTILVRGGKIVAVGSRIEIPAGAELIDLSGMTVLPGLVDCHTHLADLNSDEPLDVLKRTAAEMC